MASRRVFAYSLGVPIAAGIALCLLWLGWNIYEVQNRKRLLGWAEFHGVRLNHDETWDNAAEELLVRAKADGHKPPAITVRAPQADGISGIRQRLGDQAVECIWIPRVWRNEIQSRDLDAAFPEAKIIVGATDFR